MSKKALIIIGLILLAGAGILFWRNSYQEKSFETKVESSKDSMQVQSGEVMVELKGYAFVPDIIKVKKGTKVTWINRDNSTHTVTSDAGNEIQSPPITQGQKYEKVFDTTGTFRYHCDPHPNMIAAIIVED